MNVNLLQREAIAWDAATDDADLFLGDLDREAQAVLGYHGLYQERIKTRQRKSLRRTLIDLDVRPFTRASVEAYKQSCAQDGSRRLAEAALVGLVVGMLASLVALLVLVFSALLGFASVAFYAALVFLASTTTAVVCGQIESRYSRERTWTMRELSLYSEPIPEFALQTAVDIKKAHPEVEFYVCTLEENRVVVDPFLVLRSRAGDEVRDYYLEVWNESKFCGRRQA
jgi:hypothetical protein